MKDSNSWLWKGFFIGTGFISLTYWTACLNIVPFFITNINSNIFTHFTFANCFGSLLSFLLSPVLLKPFTNSTSLHIAHLTSTFMFFLTLFFV